MLRRDFLKVSASVAAATAIPSSLAAAAKSAKTSKSKDSKIRLGYIGLGCQCAWALLPSFIEKDRVRVVAGCDLYDIKRERFRRQVTEYYRNKGEKKVQVDLYEDYKELLARQDIDAVVIATPDHWHALVAVEALKSGKDVYLEKPMTLTVYEGQMLCKAVRKYNRKLQVGSMQRSWKEFNHATSLVREGALGKIERIKVYVGRNQYNPDLGTPVPITLPKMDVPAGLNWDKWIGPLPADTYYSEGLNPMITPDSDERCYGEWRYFKGLGGGLMTDWGAHMFDIAQWAIGKDGSGPVEVYPAGYSFYDHITYKYDNGIVMTEEPISFSDGRIDNGCMIYGEKGWIKVRRGGFECSDPKFEMPEGDFEGRDHYDAFLDAIETRVDPNCTVEIGHSSNTVCILGNIAMELGRPLKWNPIVQKFMDDPEANKKLHYEYREGYKLEI